jgi:16S rRNA (uracil1498-N3)-methyltransferase
MRTTRIYYRDHLQVQGEYVLAADAARHVRDVLRMQTGNAIVLFNGDGNDYLATLTRVTRQQVQVSVHSTQARATTSPLYSHLAQGICRGDKMDFVIQKATELGVNEITPIISEFCNVRLNKERLQKKQQHWQKIANSACEQSGRVQLVKVNAPLTLVTYLQNPIMSKAYILEPGADASKPLASTMDKVTLLVGPEGGFNEAEINSAVQQGFHTLLLGPRVLRSETAGLAALSICQYLAGDL